MRKIVWFFIILFAATFAVTLLCAADWPPGIKTWVTGGLNTVTNGIYTTMANAWFTLGQTVGATGLNFLIATLIIFFVGVFSGGFLIHAWRQHAPSALGGAKSGVGSSGTFSPQTSPAVPESAPVKTVEPVKPEQKEATA